MWDLDHKDGWEPKNWCFQTVGLEKTLQSSLDSKEVKLVNPKGNQSWIFTGRTDAEAETLILWPPDAKSQLTGKSPDAGNDWGHEEKRVTEDEMVGWHHQLNGHEFQQAPGDGEEQGSLECCRPWGCKESDMIERLNNNHHPWSPLHRVLHPGGWPHSFSCPVILTREGGLSCLNLSVSNLEMGWLWTWPSLGYYCIWFLNGNWIYNIFIWSVK